MHEADSKYQRLSKRKTWFKAAVVWKFFMEDVKYELGISQNLWQKMSHDEALETFLEMRNETYMTIVIFFYFTLG